MLNCKLRFCGNIIILLYCGIFDATSFPFINKVYFILCFFLVLLPLIKHDKWNKMFDSILHTFHNFKYQGHLIDILITQTISEEQIYIGTWTVSKV